MKPRTGSHHFSNLVDYDLRDKTAIISPKKVGADILRIAEVWGLAYYYWLTQDNSKLINKIVFDLSRVPDIALPEFECFKRRISYLNLNNPFDIEIKTLVTTHLYTKDELESRPLNEIISLKFPQRTSNDTPGRLEKDFQAFLFGDSILNANTTTINYELVYRRLGVLGIDFYKLKKEYKLIREFPTGVFLNNVNKINRILPTYYVDIVAFNKHQELSVIELKLNDPKLHVLSQVLDYALFAICYRKQLIQSVVNHLGRQFCPVGFENKPIACYVANNYFHKRFDDISQYYAPQSKGFNWKFNKIILGETKTI